MPCSSQPSVAVAPQATVALVTVHYKPVHLTVPRASRTVWMEVSGMSFSQATDL